MTVVVLIVASGAAWESPVLSLLGDQPGVVVLKRCVDVDDLLAAASAGQADVAVLGLDAPGLDLRAVDHLRHHQVRPVAIASGAGSLEAARVRAARIGIAALVADTDLASLPQALTAPDDDAAAHGDTHPAASSMLGPRPTGPPVPVPPPVPGPGGRVLVVWGPGGAPGRTTVAAAMAAELARRRLRTILVDADPYGGSVAQQLGILDEVSGLLSAARLAGSGVLAERFASVQRAVDAQLTVVTGLPRPDRWVEIRSGAVEHLLEVARDQGMVVVDTGFSLEEDPSTDYGTRPGRNQMTLAALSVADEIVVVGNADPVGLSRLARGLVELREVAAGVAVHVVVNRMRPTLGWSEKDIAAMIAGFVHPAGLYFLPEDRATVDRALVAGRTLLEAGGDGPLVRALATLVDGLLPAAAVPAAGVRSRRRRARRT